MAEKTTSTSFVQFKYCKLCKISQKRGKKHVYSKHHQTILQNMLTKFSEKVRVAKATLFAPQTNTAGFEMGAKFWCYFCAMEVDKHQVSEMTTVLYAGLLEHIASQDHKEATDMFFWDNLINKTLKPKFLLSSEDLRIFRKASFLAVKKFQKIKEQERRKIALDIEETEQMRHISSQSEQRKSQTQRIQTDHTDPTPNMSHGPDNRVQGKKTVLAFAEGLTCIIRKEDEAVEDNIFTGGVPPWLLAVDQSESSGEIGPSMSDYQKHLEKERKAKLPPGRVGAKFNHKAETSQQWLPSFGRVWSKGRRLQSKQHFEKEWKQLKSTPYTGTRRQQEKPHTVSAVNASSTSDWSAGGFSFSNGPIGNKESSSYDGDYIHTGLIDWANSSGNSKDLQRCQGKLNISPENCEQESYSDNFANSSSNSFVMPYTRKRKVSAISQGSSISLIQTPVLSKDRNGLK